MRAFTERSVVGTLFKTQTRPTHNFTETFVIYWAIQAGLLTPLNFARHRLSPLAAFTSGAYFLHKGSGDSEFANFTLPTLKAFFEARSHTVWK